MVKVRKDLTGLKFGKLTAMYQTEDYVSPSGKHESQWVCQCDCGNPTNIIVRGSHLKDGGTKSCGCLKEGYNKKYNDYKIENNIVYIKLSNCNEYTMINLDKWNQYPYIKELCWHKSSHGYAVTKVPKGLLKQCGRKFIKLHQLICPCEDNLVPDHIDRNKLNNLTENLRAVSYSDNMYNRKVINKSSGHKGVYYNKKDDKWYARIVIQLGTYDNLEEAIKAYEEGVEKYLSDAI